MAETKFKDTEVGRIPVEWEVKALGDILKFLPTNTLSRDCLSSKGKIKNIHYGDVLIRYGSVLDISDNEIPYINEKKIPSYSPQYIAQDGDIIIADTAEDEIVCKSTELWNVGANRVVSGLHTIWCRPKVGMFAVKFLGHFINSKVYHNQILSLIQGIKVCSVSKKDIKETLLLVPPLAEQERIAGALSAVDSLIEALDARIEKSRNIKQGAMQHLLNPLYNNPALLRPLGEEYRRIKGTSITANIMQRIANPSGNIIIYAGGKTIVKAYEKDIPNANIITMPAVLIQSRGIVDAIYCDQPFTFKNEMWAYTCDNIASLKYLCYYLKFDIEYFRTAAERSGMPQISIKDTEDFLIPFPSLAEQERIANILTTLDDELAALEARRAKYAAVKSGMLQALLTGTIRLSKSASECK